MAELEEIRAGRSSKAAELADAYRDLGETRRAISTSRRDVWDATAHLPVTERRETVTNAIAELHADAAVQEAEVEALRVELGQYDQQLKWLSTGDV